MNFSAYLEFLALDSVFFVSAAVTTDSVGVTTCCNGVSMLDSGEEETSSVGILLETWDGDSGTEGRLGGVGEGVGEYVSFSRPSLWHVARLR